MRHRYILAQIGNWNGKAVPDAYTLELEHYNYGATHADRFFVKREVIDKEKGLEELAKSAAQDLRKRQIHLESDDEVTTIPAWTTNIHPGQTILMPASPESAVTFKQYLWKYKGELREQEEKASRGS